MAVSLKLKACIDNCKTLLIYDNTLQNSATNPGGWNFDNPDPSDSTSTYLEITYPDNTTEIITLNPITQPTSVTTEFLLASIQLIGDGKYTIKYYVTVIDSEDDPGVPFLRSNCIEIYNLCSLRCCVDKIWASAIKDNCSCGNEKLKLALEAESLYKAILNATGSLNESSRTSLIKKLNRICNLNKCNCNK